MLSVLLAATNARVTITDLDGGVILDRQAGGAPADAPVERHPIVVEGARSAGSRARDPAGAIAAVLSYACAREADKRALAREALDRYRELNLIYDLADEIGATLETDAIARVAVAEASRLPTGGHGLRPPAGDAARPARTRPAARRASGAHRSSPASGILGAILAGDPEIVNDIAGDPRATRRRSGPSPRSSRRRCASAASGSGSSARSRSEPVEYHASDLRLLDAIASLAAPTFDQAAVHEAALPPAALAAD